MHICVTCLNHSGLLHDAVFSDKFNYKLRAPQWKCIDSFGQQHNKYTVILAYRKIKWTLVTVQTHYSTYKCVDCNRRSITNRSR